MDYTYSGTVGDVRFRAADPKSPGVPAYATVRLNLDTVDGVKPPPVDIIVEGPQGTVTSGQTVMLTASIN